VIQLPPNRLDCLTFVAGLGFDLYDWQKRALAHIQAGHPTAIVACNGAGKTSTVLAPSALWCLYTWPLAKVVVTSASHTQLERQYFAHLKRYQNHPLFKGWKFLESEVQSPAGGFIKGISVDHAGSAEGWHQDPDSPLMILVDEAKSVDDSIFTALDRCNASFKCYASSAGGAAGMFYACFTSRRDFWVPVVVKSSDCLHIPKESIERDRRMMGESSDEFRSKHLAEFCAPDGRSCIRPEDVRLAMDAPPEFEDGPEAYFVDWAFTVDGDETVVARWQGNRGEIVDTFRETPTQSVRRVAALLKARQVNEVYADAGGGGIVTNDDLWEATEKLVVVRGVHNGPPADDPEVYCSRSAQQWCEFSRELERRELILPNDGELSKQLTGRRRTLDEKSRVKLESKASMRARGLPSPDRGDSIIGAWAAARAYQSSQDLVELARISAELRKRNGFFDTPLIRF
jgi:hypothetical protein